MDVGFPDQPIEHWVKGANNFMQFNVHAGSTAKKSQNSNFKYLTFPEVDQCLTK
jgi:hypothetical protein